LLSSAANYFRGNENERAGSMTHRRHFASAPFCARHGALRALRKSGGSYRKSARHRRKSSSNSRVCASKHRASIRRINIRQRETLPYRVGARASRHAWRATSRASSTSGWADRAARRLGLLLDIGVGRARWTAYGVAAWNEKAGLTGYTGMDGMRRFGEYWRGMWKAYTCTCEYSRCWWDGTVVYRDRVYSRR